MGNIEKLAKETESDRLREYEGFYRKARDRLLALLDAATECFRKTRTFEFPTWQYGQPIGKLLKLEIEDCPRFGDTAWIEMDSARTAFISVDIQVGFCGRHGYVDVMGYDLSLTASALAPIKKCLDAVCGTGSSTDHRSSRHVSCRPRVRLLQ